MYLSIELGIIALLVAHGADPNSRNRDGQRLLHQATKKGDREVVQQLLAYERFPSMQRTDSPALLSTSHQSMDARR